MNLDRTIQQKLIEPLPFLDLFEDLRRVGMQLTLDHYDLLQQALLRGYGASWSDLQRVCRILWVKPSENYDGKTFDRVFRQYQQDCQTAIVEASPKNQDRGTEVIDSSANLRNRAEVLPEVPIRLMPERYQPSDFQGPIGIQTPTATGKLSGEKWQFTPIALPLSIAQAQRAWRTLRRVNHHAVADEIDLERTVEVVSRTGFLAEVVLKSFAQQRSELIVLVDEKAGMLPYFPALQPLFQAIEGGWISPARLYRFTGYPTRFLHNWAEPNELISIDGLLARLHRTRSIVMVISDGGAASGAINPDRVRGTTEFLDRWRSCVAQILWVNPVPESRWMGTPAGEIRELVGGQMVTLEALAGVLKLPDTERWGLNE
jgi:uncharacterized protein